MTGYLKKIGISPEDSLELQLKKYRLLLITLACIVSAPIFSFSYFKSGLDYAALVPLVYIVLILPGLVNFAVTGKYKLLLNSQLFLIFLCPVLAQWLSGGFLKGGAVILWSFL